MTNDIVLVAIAVAVMLVLFGSFFYGFSIAQKKKIHHHQALQSLREGQQNQLIEAAVRSEELERHRIAEQLHDEVGAILSSTKLHLQGIRAANLHEKDFQLYERTKELLDEGIQKVRGISHNLHSNVLKEFGLNEAIRHFVKKVLQSGLLEATTNLDDNYTTTNPENDISIYRMVQELINNILKHSYAHRLAVTSTVSNGSLRISIEHDGQGLSQEKFEQFRYSRDGLGLKNIQNRIILLKGSIVFSAEPDNNAIHIVIPQQPSV